MLKKMWRLVEMDGKLTLESVQKTIEERGAKWVAGETSLSKLSSEDVKRRFGAAPPERTFKLKLPGQFDWRYVEGKNWMTPPKDQGNCSSCVAFGTISVLEALLKIHYYNNPNPDPEIDLSEACLWACGRGGGRSPKKALCTDTWMPILQSGVGSCQVLKNYGVPEESCYPYPTTTSPTLAMECTNCLCWNQTARVNHTKIKDFNNLGRDNSEDQIHIIKKSLLINGPVIVIFEAGTDIKFYKGGIYRPLTSEVGDHCVALVGYNDTNWICKGNSGTDWGVNGYIELPYGSLIGAVEMRVYKPRLKISIRNRDCNPISNCWTLFLIIRRKSDNKSLLDLDPTVFLSFKEMYEKKYGNDTVSIVLFTPPGATTTVNCIRLQTSQSSTTGPYITVADMDNLLVDIPPSGDSTRDYKVVARVCYVQNEWTIEKIDVSVNTDHASDNVIPFTLSLSAVNQCAHEILYPFALQAIEEGQPLDDIKVAIKALLKTAEMSKEDFIEDLERSKVDLEEAHGFGITEAQGHLSATEKILNLVRSIES